MFSRNTRSESLFGLVTAGLLFFGGNASAAPVTFQFSGTVFSVDSLFSGDSVIGDTISGSYTFETSTPDSNPINPASGRYINAVSSLSYTVGGVSGSSVSNHSILVGNDTFGNFPLFHFFDAYAVFGQTTVSSFGYTGASEFRLGAGDADAGLFTNDGLPANASFFSGGAFAGPSDAAVIDIFASTGNFTGVSDQAILFPVLSGSFSAAGGISGQIRATIDSLVRVSAVSEPAVLTLFGVGFVGFQFFRRRRKITAV